ncbi:MAG: hypothetical protein KKA55_07100 [Proteobacteria bacterium]|nr:hypothetical protein [Pseudomonadota bacterium]MBU1595286.1 hypothetical protein [Pseudomonadota bacterium]
MPAAGTLPLEERPDKRATERLLCRPIFPGLTDSEANCIRESLKAFQG